VQYYSPEKAGNMTPEYFKDALKQMDMILVLNGIIEANQLICWGKVFEATTLFTRSRTSEAITLLKNTIAEFQKCFDNDETHLFLESFYQ
jgi:hypothetical protein